jgi:hypothetical protein
MRRRTLLVVLVVAVLMLVGLGVFVLWPRPDRITAENYGRLYKGMSRFAANSILGASGDHATGPTSCDPTYLVIIAMRSPEDGAQFWIGDTGQIALFYDREGCVETMEFTPCVPKQIGPLDKLLWRAERQWRYWFP